MLRLENIEKTFKGFSLRNISLSVPKGAYFMLIGSSGSGKTLLLEIISGLCTPNHGDVFINETRNNDTPIQKRNVGLVYQSNTLFPHLSVFENIAYPLKCKKIKKAEIKVAVEQIAEETEISHLLSRGVTALSGGEVQRVTIARALVNKPEILLLDEPLSSLDVQLKRGMMALLRKLHQQGQTIVHVTHDYEEALSLADSVGIIEHGVLVQQGTVKELFTHPKSEFVANFVGIKNFIRGTVTESVNEDDLKMVESNRVRFFVNTIAPIHSEGSLVVDANSIIISPQQLNSSAINSFQGVIQEMIPTRNGVEVCINIGVELYANITTISLEKFQFTTGSTVWISFKASEVRFVEE
jgi:ABC-type sugar transport system ATPase subunit